MPVVPATVEALVPDSLTIRWSKDAPYTDPEGLVTYLLETDGFGEERSADGPSIEAEVSDDYCRLNPAPDLWSMILAEELAVRLVRAQAGEVYDSKGKLLATFESEESRPWEALESVGVISLFRPRPAHLPEMHAHPLIPLDDCKITGVSFTEEQECVLDLFFDYWARPCAFLIEEEKEPILLYRPMYRFRQALFGPGSRCVVSIKAPPESRIYGAVGVRGFKVQHHAVDQRNNWTIRAQEGAFSLRTQTDEAWLTRSLPLWYKADPLVLDVVPEREFTAADLLNRKEQHWDIIDSEWGQEWYVAAHPDGRLNPFGRIYTADPTAPLLDLPGLKPKLS